MSTTTSLVNPGLANLLQNLASVGSPLLSSPQAMAALQQASPADIVQLSAQAIQLEGLDALFGQTATPDLSGSDPLLSTLYQPVSSPDPLTSLEQALQIDASVPATAPASRLSTANALASYTQNMQANEMDTLFGTSGFLG